MVYDSDVRVKLFYLCHYKYREARIRFKDAAEALGCYTYIIPSERRIHPGILARQALIKNSTDALVLWEILAGIDTYLTLEEQEKLIKEFEND